MGRFKKSLAFYHSPARNPPSSPEGFLLPFHQQILAVILDYQVNAKDWNQLADGLIKDVGDVFHRRILERGGRGLDAFMRIRQYLFSN